VTPIASWPALGCALAAVLSFVQPGSGEPPDKIRIGIVCSLFRDRPESAVRIAMPPFQEWLRRQTGLPVDLVLPMPARKLAEQLDRNEIQLGIFQGVEFAWVQQKNPKLRALAIAVNHHRYRQAHLLVPQKSAAACWADLKGKALAVPRRSREHCWLFVERHCRDAGLESSRFFARIARPANVEDALDDLIDGAVQAAVVDSVGLDAYQRRKPGRFAKLKDLGKSESFPDTVIAFHGKALAERTQRIVRDALLKSGKESSGRRVLVLWMLTAFEPVPSDFDRALSDIRKAYPETLQKSPQPIAVNNISGARTRASGDQ
jgi:ABC-type phosphate/phosphonate transport system substrate-binding protein